MTTYLYLVNGVCIDTGLAHLQKDVLQLLKFADTEMVLLTHYHEDHSGNAAKIHEKLKIPIWGSRQTKEILEKGFKILPYQHIVWGSSERVTISTYPESFEIHNLYFKPIFTPGHSSDHTVYLEGNHGWLFSGDLFISDRIKYFRSDEKFYDQILSLKKALQYDFDILFCSHRPQFKNGKEKVKNKLQFLEELYGKIKNLWEKGYSQPEIKTELCLKEDYFVKLFTFGDVSLMNMIHAVTDSIKVNSKDSG